MTNENDKKPLDCVGVTGNMGKSDFRPHDELQEAFERKFKRIFTFARKRNGEYEYSETWWAWKGYQAGHALTSEENAALKKRVSELEEALEYLKVRGVQLYTGDFRACGLMAEEIGKDIMLATDEALKQIRGEMS